MLKSRLRTDRIFERRRQGSHCLASGYGITDVLGLKHNVNLLVDYDPAWKSEFIAERNRISEKLGTIAKGIEHYGSTAVPGMRAKPILDMLVGVSPLDEWEKCRIPLETLDYDYAGNARCTRPLHIWTRSRFH